MTATEFDLLRALSVNAGRVITYDSLLRQVWGRRERGDPQLVRTYVKRLRRKIGDDADNSSYIFTVRRRRLPHGEAETNRSAPGLRITPPLVGGIDIASRPAVRIIRGCRRLRGSGGEVEPRIPWEYAHG